MFGNKWIRVGLGTAGVGGGMLLAGNLFRAHASSQAPRFEQLSSTENAHLASDSVLHVALCRLESYASREPSVHTSLLKNVAEVMASLPTAPTTGTVRHAEQKVQMVKRCVGVLRKTTSTRSSNNVEVMEEFEELARTVLDACDDRLFNLHQAYVVK
jgi:hypothetical protein